MAVNPWSLGISNALPSLAPNSNENALVQYLMAFNIRVLDSLPSPILTIEKGNNYGSQAKGDVLSF